MINIGILGPSEIAFRRFIPALCKCEMYNYVGVAVANIEERSKALEQIATEESVRIGMRKAEKFVGAYGGKIFNGYMALLRDMDIDAVYIPLPPALHYFWTKEALESGKHVIVEKPFTINKEQTVELIDLARKNNLAIHENYMFVYHDQLKVIDKLISDQRVGEPRLYRMSFGFPKREANDFRYNKQLGGGALYDCGGYPLKLARRYLGDKAQIRYAELQYTSDLAVDIGGNAVLSDGAGKTVHLAFGMDNAYKCELEIWGSKGCIYTNRIFTAPAEYEPIIEIHGSKKTEQVAVKCNDTFLNSIIHFHEMIDNLQQREKQIKEIYEQASILDSFMEKAY